MTQKLEFNRPGEQRRVSLGCAHARRSNSSSSRRGGAALGADSLVGGNLLLQVLDQVFVLDLLLLQQDDLEPALLKYVLQRSRLLLVCCDVLVCEPRVGLESRGGVVKSV